MGPDGTGRGATGCRGLDRPATLRARVPRPQQRARSARERVTPPARAPRMLAEGEGEWDGEEGFPATPFLPALAGSAFASWLFYLTLRWPLEAGATLQPPPSPLPPLAGGGGGSGGGGAEKPSGD